MAERADNQNPAGSGSLFSRLRRKVALWRKYRNQRIKKFVVVMRPNQRSAHEAWQMWTGEWVRMRDVADEPILYLDYDRLTRPEQIAASLALGQAKDLGAKGRHGR